MLATARSVRPLFRKSPATSDMFVGESHRRSEIVEPWVNVPLPLPRSTVTASMNGSATARSRCPSAGEVARDDGVGEVNGFVGSAGSTSVIVWPDVNVPSPLPRRMVTELVNAIDDGQVDASVAREVARGDRDTGRRQPGSGSSGMSRRRCPGGWMTSSRLGSATARSVRPSSLKSAATIDRRAAAGRQRDGQGLLERAVAIAGQDGHAVRAVVEDGHAEAAVAGEVAGRDGGRAVADRVGGRSLERAVALAQEHGDVGGADVSGGEVEAAVAVEIARHESRSGPYPAATPLALMHAAGRRRTVDRGLERPVAVAQEHRDVVGVGVGDGQIEMAVAEVARHDRVGIRPDGKRRHRLGANVPSPLPCRMSTALVLESVTARSRLPLPKSPATIDVGALPGSGDGLRGGEVSPALIGEDGDVAGVDVGDGQEVAVLAEVRPWRSRRGLNPTGIGLD